jgi:hypothetical protein
MGMPQRLREFGLVETQAERAWWEAWDAEPSTTWRMLDSHRVPGFQNGTNPMISTREDAV